MLTISNTAGKRAAQSQSDGTYTFSGIRPGDYTVSVTYPGFAPFNKAITVNAGATVQLPMQLSVTAEKQEITVKGEVGPNISVEPDNNATALVIKGQDLMALPDDPDDLADALEAAGRPGRRPQRRGHLY